MEAKMESETNPNVPAKLYPCDTALRGRLLALIEQGTSRGEIAQGSGVNSAIVSQYLAPEGNKYTGTIANYERRFANWLDKRDLEFLAGIPTVETHVSRQVEGLVRAVRAQRIMGKAIGVAGVGKTRAAALLAMADPSLVLIPVSGQTGTKEALRSGLFRQFGIRGGHKTYGASNVDKYRELVRRVRGADVVFLLDQAHMLSLPAMHFLCELWNETRRGQLWLGTDALLDRIERDEQIASRLEFGDELTGWDESVKEDALALIKHQIKSLLSDLNGEGARVLRLCSGLAAGGRFRRVEMRLGTMLYLSGKSGAQGRSWEDLFTQAEKFERR
jgi:DNA transposition AAA+ family ATPase